MDQANDLGNLLSAHHRCWQDRWHWRRAARRVRSRRWRTPPPDREGHRSCAPARAIWSLRFQNALTSSEVNITRTSSDAHDATTCGCYSERGIQARLPACCANLAETLRIFAPSCLQLFMPDTAGRFSRRLNVAWAADGKDVDSAAF